MPYVRLATPANGVYRDDGFIVCSDAFVVLDSSSYLLTVTKKFNPREIKLVIDLRDVEDIECRNIISRHETYEAGRIRLTGTFNEAAGQQRYTMVMPIPDYNRLCQAMETIFGIAS